MPGPSTIVTAEEAISPSEGPPRSGTAPFAVLPARERVLLAAMECVGQWGHDKTTMDDVARVAGCGRATVYRLFPDGKPELIRAAAQHNIGRMLQKLADEVEAAATLEALVFTGVHGAARLIAENAAFQYLLQHEPHRAAPHLSFQRLELVLAMARALLSPLVARFVDPTTADRIVELGARIVVTYTFVPDPSLDLVDPVVAARVVDQHILTPIIPNPGATLS